MMPLFDSINLWMIAVGALCGLSSGILGCYLVLRRMSLLGDAISHAVLPGIALAFLFTHQRTGLPIVLGAMGLGVLTAFLTASIHRLGKVPEDASMGVVFTSLFALGVILISSQARNVDLDPSCVLHGILSIVPLYTTEVFGVTMPRAFVTLLVVSVGVVVFVTLLWKELKIVTFDPALATAMGISAGLVHYLLMAMVAGVAVASFEAVGSILVIAMLIVPGATAHLLSDRLLGMLLWAALVGVLSSVFGVLLGVWLDVNVAGMMTVAAGGIFLLAVLFAPKYGLVRRWWDNLQLRLRIIQEDILAQLYRIEETRGLWGRIDLPPTPAAIRLRSGQGLGWLAVWRLRRQGMVQLTDARTLELTKAGQRRASQLVRAHRLWETFLQQELDLPLDHLHAPAERMEHYLDKNLRDRLAAAVQRSKTDPHGRPIPPPEEGNGQHGF